jgi:hypothetical protein
MRWYELINGQYSCSLIVYIRKQLTKLIVGLIGLTPEMNKTLRHLTQPVSDIDDTPLIGIDVFYQLHCLNAIRKIVYGTDLLYNPNNREH